MDAFIVKVYRGISKHQLPRPWASFEHGLVGGYIFEDSPNQVIRPDLARDHPGGQDRASLNRGIAGGRRVYVLPPVFAAEHPLVSPVVNLISLHVHRGRRELPGIDEEGGGKGFGA